MKTSTRTSSLTGKEVIVNHPPEATEAIGYYLFEAGALALIQEPAGPGPVERTRAGFPASAPRPGFADDLQGFLRELAGIFSWSTVPEAVWVDTEPGDWTEKWKEGLEPIEIGTSLVIKPTWSHYNNLTGRTVIELDPGMAFGTGRHASTHMCLTVIETLSRRPDWAGRRVLDVGTGSGILAMACAALGQSGVVAVDIDPEAMPVAAENLALGRFDDRIRLACAGPEALNGPFDLILANLTAGDLTRLGAELVRLLADSGKMVLSGILREQAPRVEEAFGALGLVQTESLDQEEWTALVLARTAQQDQPV